MRSSRHGVPSSGGAKQGVCLESERCDAAGAARPGVRARPGREEATPDRAARPRRAALLAGVGWAAFAATAEDTAPLRPAAPAPKRTPAPKAVSAASTLFHPLTGPHLAPGSDPSVLPGPVLIADRANNRLLIVNPQGEIVWEFPRPGDLRPGADVQGSRRCLLQPRREADRRHPGGRLRDQRDRHGQAPDRLPLRDPRRSGSGPNHLWNPDDAMLLPGGWILTADIKNCRVLLIKLGQHGRSGSTATHLGLLSRPAAALRQPQRRVPDARRPLPRHRDQRRLGRRADALGKLVRSWHPPGFTLPLRLQRGAARPLPERRLHHPGGSRSSTAGGASCGDTSPGPATRS